MEELIASGVSRREWLRRAPLLAAASAGLTATTAFVQERPASSLAGEKNAGARVFDVRDFGAKGDGKNLDTSAVQAAIDACTQEKGGTVLVPAGDFLVGTLELKSNVTLHLAAQGRLMGSGDAAYYKAGNGVPSGNGNMVMLYAVSAENVTIEGPGTIDGQGSKFYNGRGDNTGPGQNSAEGYFQRPHLMIFYRCSNLRVRDVFLTASAYHCMRILECKHVRLHGVRIHNRVNKNNDGFHLVSSQYVHIANCDVACQDDACALFGSCKFVTVTNCTFSTRWSVFRFGGGEAENITVSNCVIYDTYGCPVKMRCGSQSRFENILFSNLIMKNVTGPISIGLDSSSRRRADDAAAQPAKGIVRNIAFQNIRATVVNGRQHEDLPFESVYRPGENKSCIVLNGVGSSFLENISFNDVHVIYEGGGTAEEAAVRDVPQKAGEYFELGILPAYGIYARNVRGLSLHDVRFEVAAPDLRPAAIFDGVIDAAVNGFSAQGNPQAESSLRFINARDVLLTAPRLLTAAAVFLQVEGENNQGITVEGGDISKASAPLKLARGAKEGAVKLRV